MTSLFSRAALALAASALLGPATLAQEDVPSKVPLHWNRYYDHAEANEVLRQLAAAYPELVTLTTIGHSLQGREMIVAIVTDPAGGAHDEKPGMWIDGNIHGNEIQATEMILYTLWYLTKMHGVNQPLTELLQEKSFYLLPSVNPDGRQWWFDGPNTSSSSRSNQRPTDDDRDGLIDEDGPDDLDGDGSITRMYKQDPEGDWRRVEDDINGFVRILDGQEVPAEERYESLGREGIDDDGDGRVNEDGPGGDDMNRNWPADWQPPYVQRGAGPYPLSHPETRCIAEFLAVRPNVAGFQSYHNSGGMILRGPGTSYLASLYDGADNRVYDSIAKVGEDMLPYYRDMVIYRDLYNVHGGSVNWAAEHLGIVSFSNELWSSGKMFQREETNVDASERNDLFRELLQFGTTVAPFTEVDHPQHGKVLVGGTNKWSSRNTPTFMLEEECHRNFAFTAFHAAQMPVLEWGEIEVTRKGALWQLSVEIENTKKIPTRLSISRRRNIGVNDLLTVEAAAGGSATVVAAGRIRELDAKQMDLIDHEPARLQVADGIAGEGRILRRFLVEAERGTRLVLRYQAEKALDLETTVELDTPKREL